MTKKYKNKRKEVKSKLIALFSVALLLTVTAITVISSNPAIRQNLQSSAYTDWRWCDYDESNLGSTWEYTYLTGCDWYWYDDGGSSDSVDSCGNDTTNKGYTWEYRDGNTCAWTWIDDYVVATDGGYYTGNYVDECIRVGGYIWDDGWCYYSIAGQDDPYAYADGTWSW